MLPGRQIKERVRGVRIGSAHAVRLSPRALGASAASILRLVIREGILLTSLGVTLGLAGAIVVTRVLRGLLYGVTPLDGLTIASVVALVAAVALVAVGWPAWRAARVDPATALRAD